MVQAIGLGSGENIQTLFPNFTTYLANSRFRQDFDGLMLQYSTAFLEGDATRLSKITQQFEDGFGIIEPAATSEALGFLTPQGVRDIIDEQYGGRPPNPSNGDTVSAADDYSTMSRTDLLTAYVASLRHGDTRRAENISTELGHTGLTHPLAAAEKEGLFLTPDP